MFAVKIRLTNNIILILDYSFCVSKICKQKTNPTIVVFGTKIELNATKTIHFFMALTIQLFPLNFV